MTEQLPDDLADDLAGWADDDLVKALRAPGTATELADEQRYVAAYRDTGGSRVRSLTRRAGRLGAGGTAVVVTVAITSGVAAAYTGHLPDPVQQIAHTVIGAPAPEPSTGARNPTTTPRRGVVVPPPASPTASPSLGSGASPSSIPGSIPGSTPSPGTTSSGDQSSGRPAGSAPGSGDPAAPTSAPTSTATSAPSAGGSAGSASGMSMSAPVHRVSLGQSVTFTGLVTDASGTALADHPTLLQVRGPLRWRTVTTTTSDASGTVSATSPPITRSTRFRWKADAGVRSTPWLVRMVPVLSASADVGGSTTTIRVATQGAGDGDRVRVLRRTPHGKVRVGHALVDATGAAAITVRTPRRSTTYAVVLLPTRRHAGTRTPVVVVPPTPAALTISASAHHVPVGGTVLVSGVVTSGSGAVLPGHRVALLRRGPAGWRRVGHAVSDSSGQVFITTPAVLTTTGFRLRTDHGVHSVAWKVVEIPSLAASARRGSAAVTVSVSSRGARAGDQVVLLRKAAGRLVRVAHGAVAADGSVAFQVPARKARTTYVVHLLATRHHGPAGAKVHVPGTG